MNEMESRHGIRTNPVVKPLAHEIFVEAQAGGRGGNSGQAQRGGNFRRLRDIEFNHVEQTRDAKTFFDVADGSNEFGQWPGKIETLDDDKLRDIAKASLAVRVHKNAQLQTVLLKILKFAAPHHAEK